jgi:glycosyltransferase involved in cell wall biosynthesis
METENVQAEDEQLRVLIAMDRLGPDDERYHGAGKLVVEWTRALRDRGLYVVPVVLRRPGALGEGLLRAGFPIVFLERGLYDPRTLLDFRDILRDHRIQIAHLQGFGSLTFGRLAARMLGIPVVAHVHANHVAETRGYPWFVGVADRLLAPLTDRCIAVSSATVEFAVARQGFRREGIDVWPNPVDLSAFRPPMPAQRAAVRADLDVPPDAVLVVCLGRLDYVKGVDILAEAWPSVARQAPDARLLIVGDGPLRETVRGALETARALDSARLLGYRGDVAAILGAADLLVMPSRSEGSPLAALEALATGIPVVGSRVGGMPELIDDGENGLLVEPDAAALAGALTTVARDAKLRERLAAGARPSVRSRDLADYAERLEGLYRQTIADRNRKETGEPTRGTGRETDGFRNGRHATPRDPPECSPSGPGSPSIGSTGLPSP